MKSIKELYRIGTGPSSSHTMGPRKAAELFLEKHPEALNHPFYGEWVSGYVADAYHEENQVLIDLMDRLSDGYSEKQLQHLEEIFMACSRYEMAFWDMAWEMRR